MVALLPYLHHIEVRLMRATLGAGPIVRNVLPPCPRRNAVVFPAFCLVIDEVTGEALPLVHHVPRRRKATQLRILADPRKKQPTVH